MRVGQTLYSFVGGGGNPITTFYDGFGVRMKVPNLCLGVGPPSFVALKISNK